MTLKMLSAKQKEIFKWCHRASTRDKYDAIICDGAVRSGKTICMILSYIHWAMRFFDGRSFAICGKTVQSAERNIISPMLEFVDVTQYYSITYARSQKLLTVKGNGHTNHFYVFGGKDESSASLIQGITLAGVLLDEVALMPRSFVEQALARCSVDGAKFWFNCNPEHPNHWFYVEWIKKAEEKRALHLHFLMTDNPSLSEETRKRYNSLYQGVFRDRYILGEWVRAQGRVYPQFDVRNHASDEDARRPGRWYISIDYGTLNPCSMGLWLETGREAVRVKEYYYDGRKERAQKTDEEYYQALEELAGERKIECVIVDPSAASFITCIRRHGRFAVRGAENDVINGIRYAGTLIDRKKIKVHPACEDCIREFGSYVWDEKSTEDKVIKEYDHAMDDMRYFAYTVLRYLPGYQADGTPKKKRPVRAAWGVYPEDVQGGWDI